MRRIFNKIVFILLAFTVTITSQSNDVKEIMLNSGDVDLYVRIAGNSNSDHVLLGVHGGPGGSCDYMLDLEELCGDKCTVVNFDQRGSGKSGIPSGKYSLDKFAEDIEAIRKELGVNKINLFGHSWGGVVSLFYAAAYPGNVDKIVLMGSGPANHEVIGMAQEKIGERIKKLIDQGIITSELPDDPLLKLKAIMPAYYSDPGFEAPYEVSNMYYSPESATQIMRDLGEWSFDEKVSGLENEVLVLWGEDDPFGMEMGRYNYDLLKSADAKFELLENCGHYWHEQEEKTMRLLKDFLKN